MKSITVQKLLFLIVIFVFVLSCKKEETQVPNNAIIKSLFPDSPATLEFEEFVIITVEYNITHPDGARIWVQPYRNGEKPPGYLYSSSRVYYNTGIREVGISVEERDETEVIVDQLRIIITTPDQDEDLYEYFLDVEYTFTNKYKWGSCWSSSPHHGDSYPYYL